MFYAAFRDSKKEIHSNLYFRFEDFYKDTFSPNTAFLAFIEFKVHGKTYAERKESLRDIAISFQTEQRAGLSYGELAEISAWFETMGERYGLLTEFKKYCIC
jgi:hypothetical protein